MGKSSSSAPMANTTSLLKMLLYMNKAVDEIIEELMKCAIVKITQDEQGVHFFNVYDDELFIIPFAKGGD